MVNISVETTRDCDILINVALIKIISIIDIIDIIEIIKHLICIK